MVNNKVNKKIICLASGLLLIMLLMFIIININKTKSIMFYVNNEPVYEEELLNSSKELSSSIRNELMRKYKIKSEDFSWNNDIEEGKKAIEFLQEQAINKSSYEKVLQIKAKENKLIDKIDYKSIKKEMDTENENRKDNKNDSKVVYGTTNFGFSEYYQYMNNNLTIQLRNKLIDDKVLKITDEEIKSAYENNTKMFQAENKNNGKLETIPFEEVKSSAMDLGLNEKFNQYMEQEVKEASIKIKDEGRVREVLEKELS